MNITSFSGFPSGLNNEYAPGYIGRLRVQDVEGNAKIRLYEGRIVQSPLKGTPVIFKVYPGQQVGGTEADMMAANELNAHTFLQSSSKTRLRISKFFWGGFETKMGEQSVAYYAKLKSEKLSREQKSWNPFEQGKLIKRRRFFYCEAPSRTTAEREAAYLIPRLRDLAFSVDIRSSNLGESSGTLSEGLLRRASAAGATSPMEKRAFGIADEIYEAGLLFALLAFIPFCETGIMRFLESTFQLDLEATREQC